MTIGWIETIFKKNGGIIYGQSARDALGKNFDVKLLVPQSVYFGRFRYLKVLELVWDLGRLEGKKDVWVRDFYSVLTMPFDKTSGKNIAMIHHDDFSGYPAPSRPMFKIAQQVFYINLKKADAIVTVSEYWQQYFLKKGYRNVYKIYNGFMVGDFNILEEDVLDFKKRYNLLAKPIIYLGNCQRAKGVVESYKALKDLDVHLITSGKRQVKLPALNLDLDYKDYVTLLKASSLVVLMSKFREGWCRTAHEAMLCQTPVIGSGLGGMRELLEGGKQIICSSFEDLKKEVAYLLEHQDKRNMMGVDGYHFAKAFTMERFNNDWLQVIKKIM